MPHDLTQLINLREAVSIQKRIALHRACIQRLVKRAGGAHLDGVEEALDSALDYFSDAEDAMQRALDDPMGKAA